MKFGRLAVHQIVVPDFIVPGLSYHNHVLEKSQVGPYLPDLFRQRFMGDQNTRAGVIDQIKVISRLQKGVGGNRHRADAHPPEKGSDELRRIQKKQEDALFPLKTQRQQGIA